MLDIYEGCPEAFYERVTVDSVITTESAEQLHITAFMYVKGHALEGVSEDSQWDYQEFV